jgi:hypothetical protein
MIGALPKPWPEAYLAEAIADEIELANLHQKYRRRFVAPALLTQDADLVLAPRRGMLSSPGHSRLAFSAQDPSPPPRWRRNWDAAGRLSTALGLSVRHDQEEGTVSAGAGNRRRDVTERYADHPDVDAATWAAIVRAAIQKLEAGNN